MSSTPFDERDMAVVPVTRGRHLAPRPKRRFRSLGTMPVQIMGSLVGRGAVAPMEPAHGRTGVRAPSAPIADPATIEVVVAAGESVADVAARHGASTAAVLAENGLSWRSVLAEGDVLRLRPGLVRPAPSAEPEERHLVRSGETVASIAAVHAVPTAAVLLANGLSRRSLLQPGQRLVVPTAVARRDAESLPLSGEMQRSAARIIALGRNNGVPDDGIVAALVAAMHDSSLRNLDFGDGGALGLFQRRPDTGWGGRTAVLEPEHAILAFYGGEHSPVRTTARGLLDVPDWALMSIGEAAAAVQGGGRPSAYAKWEPFARRWLADLG